MGGSGAFAGVSGGRADQVEGIPVQGEAQEAVLLEGEGDGPAVHLGGERAVREAEAPEDVAEAGPAEGGAVGLDKEIGALVRGFGGDGGAVKIDKGAPPVALIQLRDGALEEFGRGVGPGRLAGEAQALIGPQEQILRDERQFACVLQADEDVLRRSGAREGGGEAFREAEGIGAVRVQRKAQREAAELGVPIALGGVRLRRALRRRGGGEEQHEDQDQHKQLFHGDSPFRMIGAAGTAAGRQFCLCAPRISGVTTS